MPVPLTSALLAFGAVLTFAVGETAGVIFMSLGLLNQMLVSIADFYSGDDDGLG